MVGDVVVTVFDAVEVVARVMGAVVTGSDISNSCVNDERRVIG